MIASNPNVFSIHPSLPATTIPQFISLAKANPGKLNFGSAGIGSSRQLSMELFKIRTHINIVHIAYKGVSPALLDLIGGRIEALTSTVPSVLPAVRQRKVRALGVTSAQRDADLPEVPTVAESGIADFEVVSWQGLCAPAATPPAALARLRAALAAALDQPEVRKRLVDQGFTPHVLPADKFAAYIAAERANWLSVVKTIGIKPQ